MRAASSAAACHPRPRLAAGAAVEPNFDLDHDRRLRKLAAGPGGRSSASASPPARRCCLGPDGAVEIVGTAFVLEDPEGDFEVLEGEDQT